MPDISLLLKPASSACDLRCGYCFYRDIADDARKETYRKKHGCRTVNTAHDAVLH